ncbi:MAG: hypothetical protein ABWX94_00405, partial [Candidatus Saccharimonadales bacterium]
MHKITTREHGFSHILIPLFIIVLAVVGFAGYKVVQSSNNKNKTANTTTNSEKMAMDTDWPINTEITWGATGDGAWMPFPYDVVPPACPDPLNLELPTTEIKKATSILYPGQSRSGTFEGKGGTYKAHGGIRFD